MTQAEEEHTGIWYPVLDPVLSGSGLAFSLSHQFPGGTRIAHLGATAEKHRRRQSRRLRPTATHAHTACEL